MNTRRLNDVIPAKAGLLAPSRRKPVTILYAGLPGPSPGQAFRRASLALNGKFVIMTQSRFLKLGVDYIPWPGEKARKLIREADTIRKNFLLISPGIDVKCGHPRHQLLEIG